MSNKNNIIEKIEDAYWACYRLVRDKIFEPVWYRFFGHKHHIIKTKLTPAPWYDADTRILYSVMAIVEWFVENDMRRLTQEEFEEEIKRIKKEEPKEHQAAFIKTWTDQYKQDQEIVGINDWWKAYLSRCKDVDDSISDWSDYMGVLSEKYADGDFFSMLRKMSQITIEEKDEECRLYKLHTDKKEQLEKEEQEYLKKAIDLRRYMWS